MGLSPEERLSGDSRSCNYPAQRPWFSTCGGLDYPHADNRNYEENRRQYDGELEQGLFQSTPRAAAALTSTEEAATALFDLGENHKDYGQGHYDLNRVKSRFQGNSCTKLFILGQ